VEFSYLLFIFLAMVVSLVVGYFVRSNFVKKLEKLTKENKTIEKEKNKLTNRNKQLEYSLVNKQKYFGAFDGHEDSFTVSCSDDPETISLLEKMAKSQESDSLDSQKEEL